MAIERIVPGTVEWEAYYANHIMRYQFASQIIHNKSNVKLLDAACGVGYGSKYLSELPWVESVVAIDRSPEALKIANTKFSSSNLTFLEDDCHTLAVAKRKGQYNAVISFETLEHLPKPAEFLKNCFEAMDKGATLIISTPNQLVSSPDELNWEFHEKEYTPQELYDILQLTGFRNIEIYGQQYNLKGKIKNELRGELNKLWSNPFSRIGRWLQSKLRGYKLQPVLKETIDDFEIVHYEDLEKCVVQGRNGPFVLIATGVK